MARRAKVKLKLSRKERVLILPAGSLIEILNRHFETCRVVAIDDKVHENIILIVRDYEVLKD